MKGYYINNAGWKRCHGYRQFVEGDCGNTPHAEGCIISKAACGENQMSDNATPDKVCAEILEIMATYHEQDAAGGVDTPGGLEHMGDVWRLFRKWERLLLETHHE